jgi:aryl-alcohol dehydrogenase-like predicted oxidoreductase
VEGIISQTRHGRSKGRRHRHSRRCRKRAPTEGKQTGLQWEGWRQAHLGDLLDGMTPMEFILRFTFTNPDLDTTIVGTISPEHLQTNLDILQKGPLPPDLYEEAKHRLAAAGSAPQARDE